MTDSRVDSIRIDEAKHGLRLAEARSYPAFAEARAPGSQRVSGATALLSGAPWERRSTRLRLAMVALGALSLLVTRAALAEPTPADRETARSLMQEGRDLRDGGDVPNALKRFKAADDIMHVPTTGLELARAQVSLGLLVEARDTIASIRKTPVTQSDPEPFNTARAKADELDASLETMVPALTITVRVTDGSTPTISIDGVPLPPATVGLPRRVDPGHHRIVAKAGSVEGSQDVEVHMGERKDLRLSLEGGALIAAESEEPPAAPDVSTSSEPRPLRSHTPTPVTFVGIGVATAGLIVGTVTGILSWSGRSSLDGRCPKSVCPPGPPSDDLDSANTLATISTVSLVLAGAGGAAAVVSLAVGHAPVAAPPALGSRRGGVKVEPWIGLGSAGLRGAF